MLKSLDESPDPDNKPIEQDVLSCAQDLIRMSSPRLFDQSNGEVVADSFQQLSFGLVHEEVNGLSISKPSLSPPPNCQMRKKLLILDINGVLVDIVSPLPKERKADINIARRAGGNWSTFYINSVQVILIQNLMTIFIKFWFWISVFKRPFYLDFMKFCFERFEIGIWSSRNRYCWINCVFDCYLFLSSSISLIISVVLKWRVLVR